MEKLSAVDRTILNALLQDARTPDTRLAKIAGLSRQTVARRISDMIDHGIIRSFETRIAYERLGFTHYEVWMSVRGLVGGRKDAVIRFLVDHPFLRWVGECITTYNLRATFIAMDDRHMERIVTDLYAELGEDLERIEVLVITDVAKHVPADTPHDEYIEAHLTLGDDLFDHDGIDVLVLELLSADPRRRLSEIAERVGLTLEAVRQRVKRLRDGGVILGFTINVDPRAIDTFWMILLVNFSTLNSELKRKLLTYTREKAFTGRTYVLLGSWHYHMTLNGGSVQELADHIRDFEAHFAPHVRQYLPVLVTDSFKYPKVPVGVFDVMRQRIRTTR